MAILRRNLHGSRGSARICNRWFLPYILLSLLHANVGLRPMDGVACGQKSGKIWENSYSLVVFSHRFRCFRIVFAIWLLEFLDCEKTRKGRKGRKSARCASRREARCASFGFMSHRTDERASGEASQRLELSRARRREAKPNHGNHRKISLRLMSGIHLRRIRWFYSENRQSLLVIANNLHKYKFLIFNILYHYTSWFCSENCS